MSAVSAPVIRRPRDPVSDDEAKEKRKEQNRQAQAKARAKKKEAQSAGANPLQSIPETPKMKMTEEIAKDKIGKAVKIYKAKKEVNDMLLKLQDKIAQKAKEYLKATPEVSYYKNGKIAFVEIEEDLNTFKKYVRQYPEVLEKIKNYHHRTVRDTNKDGAKIYLKYRPFADYDFFTFSYPLTDGTIKDFSFKIDYNADTRYSVYLYNQNWRYNYYKWQDSIGSFKDREHISIKSILTRKDDDNNKIPIYELYPEVIMTQNYDNIPSVPENESLITSKHLYDSYQFFQNEDWYKKKQRDEYSDMFKKTIIYLGEPDPSTPKTRPESASPNLGRASTSSTMKVGRGKWSTESAKGRLQANTSSRSRASTISARSDSSAY